MVIIQELSIIKGGIMKKKDDEKKELEMWKCYCGWENVIYADRCGRCGRNKTE